MLQKITNLYLIIYTIVVRYYTERNIQVVKDECTNIKVRIPA
jgi:hypothetical protein